MTCYEIAMRLVPYIGNTGLDANREGNGRNSPELTSGIIGDIATHIQAGAQEVWRLAQGQIGKRPFAVILRPPATLSMRVEKYSKTISELSGYDASWMKTCSVAVGVDQLHNVIVNETELLRPYNGTSGVVQAQLYGDAVPLPSNIQNVIEPVEMPGIGYLDPATDWQTFRGYNLPDVHTRHGSNYGHYSTVNKSVGRPALWMVEGFYDDGASYLPLYLRVNPMPNDAYPLTFTVNIKPPRITEQDVTFDGQTDPLTSFPGDWHESILLPVILQHWTAHPGFKNNDVKPEIKRQYDNVIAQIKSTMPQISRLKGRYK